MPQQGEFRFGDQLTYGHHRMDEVVSALQKAIRRGEEEQALQWSSELDLSGFAEHAWTRLRVIAMEDVGLGNADAIVQVQALYQTWDQMRKKKNDATRLALLMATSILARSPESRAMDDAYVVVYEGPRDLEIPDVALDMHTAAGRQKHRFWAFWWREGTKLENEAFPSPFLERAKDELVHSKKRQHRKLPWEQK